MTTTARGGPAATATVLPADVLAVARERSRGGILQSAGDCGLVAGRNIRKLLRTPQLIVFSTIQPVMFLLLFSYVFGGVAKIPFVSYKDYIVPTVLVQTLVFAATASGIGLANDLQSGMIDRFRSLPIARSAVLVGRTASDALRITFQGTLVLAVATLIGFGYPAGVPRAFAMLVVGIAFGVCISVFSAWIGLTLRDPETVQVAGFIPIFPLVFVSSGFAPIRTLPTWMQGFARINPITSVIDTMRGLALGFPFDVHLASSAWHATLWMALILGVFTTLSVRQYRKI